MNLREHLRKVEKRIGNEFQFEGIVKMTGRIKINSESATDVLGFDYVGYSQGSCFEYYSANPPLTGTTGPIPVYCPVGLEAFTDIEVDYRQALNIYHRGNWGESFRDISLFKPLHPTVKEPCWYILSSLGVTVVIGALSGEIIHAE